MADIFQSIAILCVAITGIALPLYYRGLRDRVDVIQRWLNSVKEHSLGDQSSVLHEANAGAASNGLRHSLDGKAPGHDGVIEGDAQKQDRADMAVG